MAKHVKVRAHGLFDMWYETAWYVVGGIILIAMLLDRLGDPPNRYHPTAWMGSLVAVMIPVRRSRLWGVAVVVICCGLAALLPLALWWTVSSFWVGIVGVVIYGIIAIPILKSTISLHGMEKHAAAIHTSILNEDGRAAGHLACIVKRSTSGMSTSQICSGTVESISENTVDGITGPLLYAGLAGLPGALVYRTINTIDSMAGYRSEFFGQVGWFGAMCDTVLNWIPARVTGYVMVLAAAITRHDWRGAYRIMRQDAGLPESANSGYPMAAMAGALNIRLEKPLHYTLGEGRDPVPDDIIAAVRIMKCTVWLFAALAAAVPILVGVVYGGLF